MISIDRVYKTVQALINKENSGYINPTDFNLFAKYAQDEIFRNYFDELNREINKENRGLINKGYANLPQLQLQKINIFSTLSTLPVVGGVLTLPSDLYWIEPNGLINSTVGMSPSVIEQVTQGSSRFLNCSEVAPTESFPVFENYGDTYRITPDTITSVNIQYLRCPADPVWTYSTITSPKSNGNGNNVRELFNPSLPDFKDFELHKTEFVPLVLGILTLSGINLREAQVAEIAENLKDKDYNKTNN